MHSQADTQIGNIVFPGIFGNCDFTFNTSNAKTTGNKNTLNSSKFPGNIFFLKIAFAIYPDNFHLFQ